ncbi:hypothetical protein MJO29_003296 [Puccinia striiformis f. sp. tritici]|nr:hypothetical protein MJO29_003296 [Puccinia striiformis f. sp. tritici]
MTSHPFRPPPQAPLSSRSKETPMDFTYDNKPGSSSSSSSYLSTLTNEPSKSTIRALKVIDQNGNHTSNPPSQSHDNLKNREENKSISWFRSLAGRSTPEPPRKRLHCETVESMDWESCPAEPRANLFPNVDSTQTSRAREGGTFLFKLPEELPPLPEPPIFTAPSSILLSPQKSHKIGPEAFGCQSPRARSIYRDDQDPDSSLDIIDQTRLLQPTKMYSTNAVKHENRRRTRVQKQLRSKLNSLKFDSDDDDEEEEDSDVEVVSSKQQNLVSKSNKKSSRKRIERVKSDPPSRTSTNNYLTINGWKGSNNNDKQERSNPSRLSTDTPYILLVYLQLLFNSSLVFVGLYLAINLILIIRTDINHKVLVHTNRLRSEIDLCTKEYNSNRCYPVHLRTQFIEKHCIEWETCMNRNPNLISRSRIGAETFAEVMNGFVDVISWKTMLFIFLIIGAGIYATNLAMNNYKSKWEPYHHHQPHHQQQSNSSSWNPRLTTTTPPQANHLHSNGEDRNTSTQVLDPVSVFGRDHHHHQK